MEKELKMLSASTILKDMFVYESDSDSEEDTKPQLNHSLQIKRENCTDEAPAAEIKIKFEPNVKIEVPSDNLFAGIIKQETYASVVKQEPNDDDDEEEEEAEAPDELLGIAEMALQTPVKLEQQEDIHKNVRSVKKVLGGGRQRYSPYVKEKRPAQRSPEEEGNYYEPKANRSKREQEVNPEVLARRQKQIDYGKNTIGYDNYIKQVPKQERKPDDPQTPNKYRIYSRRGFDGLVKQWRMKLHKYDP